MKKNNTRILITGVAGFIGSNLAKQLLILGYKVIGVDNFSYGLKSNMDSFFQNASFTFFDRDITLLESLQDLEADVLVHLASY